jgi:hypothetical protein
MAFIVFLYPLHLAVNLMVFSIQVGEMLVVQLELINPIGKFRQFMKQVVVVSQHGWLLTQTNRCRFLTVARSAEDSAVAYYRHKKTLCHPCYLIQKPGIDSEADLFLLMVQVHLPMLRLP